MASSVLLTLLYLTCSASLATGFQAAEADKCGMKHMHQRCQKISLNEYCAG
jgi:hypothetical protein